MTEDELVEKVAQAMEGADDYYVSRDQARAAIAVLRPLIRNEALEEVARIVDGNAAVCQGNIMLRDILEGNAAAIRALIATPLD